MDCKVLILNFNTLPNYKQTGKICETDEPVTYEIIYMYINDHRELNDDLVETIMTILQGICSEIVIYNNNIIFNDFIIQLINILPVHIRGKLFNVISPDPASIIPYYKTVSRPKIEILNCMSSIGDIRHFLPDADIENILYFSKIQLNGALFYFTFELNEAEPNLECTWWFKRYITNAFESSKNRLRQFSGTCYLNVILNAFILNKYPQKLIIRYMNEYMRLNPDSRRHIYDALSDKCQESELVSFFKIINNVVCQNIKINYYKKDMIKNLSDTFFRALEGPVEGGYDFFAIYTLLRKIGIGFFVIRNNYVFDGIDLSTNVDFRRTGSLDGLVIPYASTFLNKTVALENINGPIANLDLAKNITIAGVTRTFDLEFAVIKFVSVNATKQVLHVVLGYKSGGYYKIYDSELNLTFNFRWTHLLTEQAKFVALFNKYYNRFGYRLVELNYTTAFYLENSIKPELDQVVCQDFDVPM